MDRSVMAIARMIVSQALTAPPTPRWTAACDTRKPTSGKDRSKIKAARKQRIKK